MIRFKRRNLWWLAVLGAMVGIALVGNAPALLQAFLLAIFFTALAMSLANSPSLNPFQLWSRLQQIPVTRRATPRAREATERARRRGGHLRHDMVLIVTRTDEDGISMRRSFSANLDDDGVRPYIVLHVSPAVADRYTQIRYEIYDQNGGERYIYTMNKYLDDGEVNVIADNHLPLAGNEDIDTVGDWELRVYIDGDLYAVENFTVTSSLNPRRYLRMRNGQSQNRLASLDELLRQSRRQQRE